MPPPPYTQLDYSQVIRQVYDEALNRLRVDIGATIVAGALEVAINDVTDSIKIGGGGPGPYLVINPDGSINVTTTVTGSPNVNIHDSAGANILLGQKTMALSVPVVIASDQSAVPVSNANLVSIDGKLNSLGQKASAGSVPVVLASDQSTIAISAASLPLPTGAATAANQVTGNASLSSIDGKLNSLGQKTMAASVPVVLASDQSPIQTIQIFTKPYDAITATYPTTTQEVYQSRVGGIAGVVQETVTVNYTDATKAFVLNVART